MSVREPFFDCALVFFVFFARELRTLYRGYLRIISRISPGQWQRWLLLEPISEALTLVLGGLILLLAFGVSTIRAPLQEDWLKASSVTACLFDRFGHPIGSEPVDRGVSVPFEEFPDVLIKATLATEDRHFYDHFDIDLPGALHALLMRTQNDRLHQDGSSITQQLARSLFLNGERGIDNTVKGILHAVWLEWHLTKDEVLRLYLNCINLGGDALGFDGAARFYFNKTVREVNLAEAAMLVGLIEAPTRYAPHIDLTAARTRANVVLDNLVATGFMTEDQVLIARSAAARVVIRGKMTSPN
ncbi:transglycosylase domain-containing protein [Bradyrhizobium sp. Pa8]|uniref:transglycosylase domain-containing protein n=1 Tax=Bradyrhizobium sp. Pa8 TaxID=3386552 RepID=UPI00403F3B91